MTDPAEAMTLQVAQRVFDLLISVVDVNELAACVDLNALLSRLDLNALLERTDIDAVLANVDVNALLDRVNVNDLVGRLDMDALVQHTDLGAVIVRSSSGVGSDILDAARSQAVGLDLLVDRWVKRVLRRKQPGPSVPVALLPAAQATS